MCKKRHAKSQPKRIMKHGLLLSRMAEHGQNRTPVRSGDRGQARKSISGRDAAMPKRIFVSFAVEDERYRDLLKGQSLNTKSPFEYVDMSVKEPWDSKWKTNCRIRIKGCDGVIVLISRHTRNADGAKWEMQCANEECIPMMGVHIHSSEKGQIPPQLGESIVTEWNWGAIKDFIDSL